LDNHLELSNLESKNKLPDMNVPEFIDKEYLSQKNPSSESLNKIENLKKKTKKNRS